VGVGDGAQRYAGVLGEVAGVSCVMDALDSRHRRPFWPWRQISTTPAHHRRPAPGRPPLHARGRCHKQLRPGHFHLTVVMMELRIEKLKRRDLRHLLPIERPCSPNRGASVCSTRAGPPSWAALPGGLAQRRHGRVHRLHDRRRGGPCDDDRHAPGLPAPGGGPDASDRWDPHLLPMGVRHLSLEVRPATKGRRRSTGARFAPVGVRKNYYPITGEDAAGDVGLRHRHA